MEEEAKGYQKEADLSGEDVLKVTLEEDEYTRAIIRTITDYGSIRFEGIGGSPHEALFSLQALFMHHTSFVSRNSSLFGALLGDEDNLAVILHPPPISDEPKENRFAHALLKLRRGGGARQELEESYKDLTPKEVSRVIGAIASLILTEEALEDGYTLRDVLIFMQWLEEDARIDPLSGERCE